MAQQSSKQLITGELTRLAKEIICPDGVQHVTRAYVLAKVLWIHALGGVIDMGPDFDKVEISRPEPWAIKLILERLDGKAAPAPDIQEDNKDRASDRIGELSMKRLNELADEHGPEKTS